MQCLLIDRRLPQCQKIFTLHRQTQPWWWQCGEDYTECLQLNVWHFQRWLKVLGDEPEGVGLAEIGLLIQSSSPQCGGKPHEERDAKVSEAETQFCQNMWVDTFLNCRHILGQGNSRLELQTCLEIPILIIKLSINIFGRECETLVGTNLIFSNCLKLL